MRHIIALVLISFLGMNVHAQGEPPVAPTPPATNGMDEAPRDPAKAHHKKGKKKKAKKHKGTPQF